MEELMIRLACRNHYVLASTISCPSLRTEYRLLDGDSCGYHIVIPLDIKEKMGY